MAGREVDRWGVTDGLPGSFINALLVVTDTLWIGGSEGLAMLNLQNGQIADHIEPLEGHFVDALALGQDGAIWTGTHWGANGENAAVYRFAHDER